MKTTKVAILLFRYSGGIYERRPRYDQNLYAQIHKSKSKVEQLEQIFHRFSKQMLET